jgi:hypothetical protein
MERLLFAENLSNLHRKMLLIIINKTLLVGSLLAKGLFHGDLLLLFLFLFRQQQHHPPPPYLWRIRMRFLCPLVLIL